MKILYHHRVGSKDGQAVHIESLVTAFRRIGHEVCIVGPPAFDKVDFGGQPGWFAGLKRLLPRVVYELLEIGYNLPALWRLWRARKRFGPDFIYERYNLFMVAGAILSWICQIPLALEVNAPLAQERAAFGGLLLSRLATWLEHRVWQAADFVLPVSEVLAETVRQSGVPAERIIVVPNGIDEEVFRSSHVIDPKSTFGLHDKIVLGFVGFVREWHGLDDVVALLADPQCPPDLHFLVVGDGPALPALKSRAHQLGVKDRVTFAGLAARDNIARYVAAFDIALQPRAVRYASPLKIFEYMAAGKAIVAPNQENIREILLDGQTAMLFCSGDKVAFKKAVFSLAADKAMRMRLGERARVDIIARHYTWIDNAERVCALYNHESMA